MKMKTSSKKPTGDEEDDPISRAIRMVLFFTFQNILFKIPSTIIPFNEMRLSLGLKYNFNTRIEFNLNSIDSLKMSIDFKVFCFTQFVCFVFQKFTNSFFLISVNLNFFSYFKFDKNFKIAFYNAFKFVGAKKS